MASAQAFPPQRSQPSRAVSSEEALNVLQAYISAIPQSPYLLPNARLDVHGPSAQASSSSVVIHNLQRVEAGLRGEWLAPVLELEDSVDDGTGEGKAKGKKRFNDEGTAANVTATSAENSDGWQDLGEYQRAQSVEEGGGEAHFDAAVMDEEELHQQEDVHESQQATQKPSKNLTEAEKKARKKAKKDRHKLEKKSKANKHAEA